MFIFANALLKSVSGIQWSDLLYSNISPQGRWMVESWSNRRVVEYEHVYTKWQYQYEMYAVEVRSSYKNQYGQETSFKCAG
jgi:hypothetical protein